MCGGVRGSVKVRVRDEGVGECARVCKGMSEGEVWEECGEV